MMNDMGGLGGQAQAMSADVLGPQIKLLAGTTRLCLAFLFARPRGKWSS